MKSEALKADVDLLLSASKEGNFDIIKEFLEVLDFDYYALLHAYKIATKRALKLKPNAQRREDMVDEINLVKNNFNQRKTEKDLTLCQQGTECQHCADFLYDTISCYFSDDIKATHFAYTLCKLNSFELLYDFNLLYFINIDYQFVDYTGKSFLHIASKHGNLDIVKFLLEQKVNINLQDWFSHNRRYKHRTALHYAVENLHFDVVKILMDQKCNVNICDFYGRAPLHQVAPGEKGNMKMFELLISGGANINLKFKDTTMLYQAVKENESETVKYLLSLKASPFVTSLMHLTHVRFPVQFEKYYQTPLDLAVKREFENFEEEIENLKIIFLLTEAMMNK